MNFTLCSSLPDIPGPCFESFPNKNTSIPLSKPSTRTTNSVKKDNIQLLNHDLRMVAISSHYVPGQLEGTYIEEKQVLESRQKLEFVRTLLIDNYDSYTYNIYQELSVVNGLPPVVVHNDEWTWEDAYYYIYEKRAFDNIVISPGPGSPACSADIGICLKLLQECGDIPILGVCLGHQALGYVHGAEIVHAYEPVHGRLSEIQHNGCQLFQDVPSGRNSGFKVVRYHSLVIDEESLPKDLIPLAWTCSSDTLPFLGDKRCNVMHDAYKSQFDQETSVRSFSKRFENGSFHLPSYAERTSNKKVLMGIMHSTRPHYGVQFHPESVATCYGNQIFKNFRQISEDYWGRFSSSSIHQRKVHSGSHQFEDNPSRTRFLGTLNDSSSFSMCTKVNLANVNNGVKFLKLKWRKLKNLACQIGGAQSIFRELFGAHKAENTFWLDSSSTEKRRARFSFMGGKGGSLWKQVTFRLSDQRFKQGSVDNCLTDILKKLSGGYLSIEDAQGLTRTTFLEAGFFHFLDEELQSFQYEEKDFEGLPFDFYGGYVGYLGYGLKVECGMSFNRHKSGTPDACLFFSDNLVVIDHCNDDVYIMSIHEGNTTNMPWLDDVEQKLINLKTSALKDVSYRTSDIVKNASIEPSFFPDKTSDQYMKDVKKCQEYIRDGESYELCLTTQMRKKIGDINALGLYLRLREKNPAPYAAWLNFSKEKLSICCSSPERFLRLNRDGILEAKPIKGTIARGTTPEDDEMLKSQLQYSEKDQAENLMIVDLLRNDLGRVCEPGSVHVPNLMEVESYASVHTMVSTIRGKKQPNLSAVDCVRAAFPGGSMTGAPKLRSMELLDSLESCPRGIYSGCIGFFSYNQIFDLNIVIRTIVIHNGEASVGAGGAIVALSNPEEEYKEMVLKTRAPVSAVMEYETLSLLEK